MSLIVKSALALTVFLLVTAVASIWLELGVAATYGQIAFVGFITALMLKDRSEHTE